MKAYLRGLADEFGESTNAIRLELNRMEEAGLLCSEEEGNKKIYHANPQHPLFGDIRSLVLKHSGITQIIEEIVTRVGDIQKVWICGTFAEGKDSGTIDLLVSASHIDTDYFISLVKKTEELIQRKIDYTIISPDQENEVLVNHGKVLLIWTK